MALSINQLENVQVKGCYTLDHVLFYQADKIITNPSNPMAYRIRAIRVINKAMGADTPKVTPSDVAQYMANI